MILSLDDITHMPDDDWGWFYGVVKRGRRVGVYEIFPGLGYGTIFPLWRPNMIWHLIRDVTKQLKAGSVARLSDAEYEERNLRKEREIENAEPWSPDWLVG